MAPANYTHVNSRGIEYHLNTKVVTLKGGHTRSIYYFSKDHRDDTATFLPDGMTVVENKINGFVMAKKAA